MLIFLFLNLEEYLDKMLQFLYSKSHPRNIFFINAESLQDKIDLGALLSRYSRSDKPAEELYKDEFLTNPDRGNKFYAKVFGQYGDESISELVPHGFAVCFENIPVLWSTYLLHYRTLSAIEKSTRYVKAFDYYRPKKWQAGKDYHDKCKNALEVYEQEFDRAFSRIGYEAGLKFNDVFNPAIARAVKARALDECRIYLPLSTVTSLGIMANLRAWLNILAKEKVRNDPSIYTQNLIDPLIELFKEHFPTIFSNDKLDYLQKAERTIHHSKLDLELYDDNIEGLNDIREFELKYTIDAGPKFDYYPYVEQVDRIKKIKPIREYEMLDYTISIPDIEIATFRDIQRHRYFTILVNRWDLRHDTEEEINLLTSPLGTKIEITIKGNLRQWTHAIELRTQEQGHPRYRKLFQECGKLIADNLRMDKEILFPYADWRKDSEIGLGRLKAEIKKESK